MSTIQFPLPSDPSKYVELKSSWSWADAKAMEAARAAAPNEASGALAFAQVLLERIIVGWNLTDEQNNRLVINQASIDTALTDLDAQAIIVKVVDLRKGVTGAALPNS